MPRPTLPLGFTLLLMLLAPTGPLLANDTPLTYDRIDFSVRATRPVDNDTLVSVLYFQREGEDSGQLADTVNRNIDWAVAKARQVEGVKIQTLDYYTNPLYRKQKLVGWRVSQSLRLESQDSALLSKLIADLQQRLAVRSIRYDVSPQRRSQVENELIAEAIQRFGKRAQLITGELSRPGYRLVRMNVNSGGSGPAPVRQRMMAMEADTAIAAPNLEAGTQTLQVSISGTIELKLN